MALRVKGQPEQKLNLLSIEGWEQILAQTSTKTAAYYMGALRKRATVASIIPRVIRQGENEIEELPFRFDMARLMWSSMFALDSFGVAYHGLQRNRGGGIFAVHQIHPNTMRIEENPFGGIRHFVRQMQGKAAHRFEYDPVADTADDLVFIFANGLQEYGPGQAIDDYAKLPAELLASSDKLMKALFDRGAIAQHMVRTSNNPPQAEKDRLQSRLWRLFFGGVDRSNGIEVFNDSYSVEKVGTDPKDLALGEVDKGNQLDISVITDTPMVVMEPGTQINRASLDRITSNYINYSILPQAKLIVNEWNRQILEPMGFSVELNAQAMSVEQGEENDRAAAYATYIATGMPAETAAALLGIDVPEGSQLQEDDPEPVTVEVETPAETRAVDATREDEYKLLRRFVENGTHEKRPFNSNVLTAAEIEDYISMYEGVDYP